MSVSERIIQEVSSWAGVRQQSGHFGATAFVLEDGRELGHIHGEMVVDIPCTQVERALWIEDGLAEPHRYAEGFGVSVFLNSELDVEHALALLRERYEGLGN